MLRKTDSVNPFLTVMFLNMSFKSWISLTNRNKKIERKQTQLLSLQKKYSDDQDASKLDLINKVKNELKDEDNVKLHYISFSEDEFEVKTDSDQENIPEEQKEFPKIRVDDEEDSEEEEERKKKQKKLFERQLRRATIFNTNGLSGYK